MCLRLCFKEDVDPERYVEEHGLKVINDTDALTKTIEELLEKNPQSVADFKAGKESHGLYRGARPCGP